jgi:4-hydroxybenzoate polyprenyltransferase
MAPRLRPYFELCRVFLTPTAVGDSFAGHVLAAALEGRGLERMPLLFAAASSVSLYWGGMVSNDLFDLAKDRETHPRRPLPSGRVSPRAAAALYAILSLAALGLGALAGALSGSAAVLVLAAAYNAGGKSLPVVGCVLMGGCRTANFLLGALSAGGKEALDHDAVLIGAGLLGLYVALITAVSTLEDRPHRPWAFWPLGSSLLAAPAAFIFLRPASPFVIANSSLLAMLVLSAMWAAGAQVKRGAAPHPAAVLVRRTLPGILLVDSGALLALAPDTSASVLRAACVLYALLALGWLWKRRWLQSGATDT